MNNIFPGRYTAQISEPCVVFLIGMRVNHFWAFTQWLPIARAMGPMLEALSKNPDKGLLEARTFFRMWPLETCIVSYWRSFEDLTRFARSKDDPHWAAWQQFMRSVGSDGSVGIWHETYQIEPGKCEAIYGNMPVCGLAAATTHLPISEKTRNATARMTVST